MATGEKTAVLIFLAVIACIYSLELLLLSIFAFQKLTGSQGANILLGKPALCIHALAIIGIASFCYGQI